MKKIILFFALLTLSTINVSAQFKVFSGGNANIMCSSEYTTNKLSVGLTCNPSSFYNFQNCIQTKTSVVGWKHNVALYGESSSPSAINSGRAFGVLGIAGNSTNGYNYGVFGKLYGDQNGAGVYGSSTDIMGKYINGKYAGYFNGPTHVEGTLTATSVITTSDIRLKENIVPIVNNDKGNTLDNILKMNVIEYNYKQREIPNVDRDTLNNNLENSLQDERHYGLSAQELQTIYPILVKKGQDGYLGVNYIEMIPVLIRAIQELKEELDAVKGSDAATRKAPITTSVSTTSTINGNILYQNTPNPFKEQTIIRFSLADNANNASICIFDMVGKILKKLPISSGETSVSINGWELGEGMFFYTLIVNGKEIDTKKMIIMQ